VVLNRGQEVKIWVSGQGWSWDQQLDPELISGDDVKESFEKYFQIFFILFTYFKYECHFFFLNKRKISSFENIFQTFKPIKREKIRKYLII